MIQELARQDRI